jgi:hypothetical protein
MLRLLKSKKVIIPVASLIFILGFLIYFSDRLTLVIIAKFVFSKTKTPEAYLIPILREVKLSQKKFKANSILSYKQIKLKAPWELREKLDLDLSTFFTFVNKKGISIEQQSTDESILQSLLKEEPLEVQKYNLLFGEENLKSEYAIVNLILNTTPDQAGISKPLPELARIHPLLIGKALYAHLGDVIYKFKANNLKGFQFGNPQNTENVRVHVFNEKDQVFRLHFIRATQAEIDYILSTIEFF